MIRKDKFIQSIQIKIINSIILNIIMVNLSKDLLKKYIKEILLGAIKIQIIQF